MPRTLRLSLLLAVVGAFVVGGTTLADGDGHRVLDANLVGLPAEMTGQTLFGVVAGGLPWRIQSGNVRLFADGRLRVDVDGLVLATGPKAGTNPIPHAQAIVICAGMPAAMSSVVSYSMEGDAHIHETVALPAHCLAPAVFFAGVPAPGVDLWFAVTGS